MSILIQSAFAYCIVNMYSINWWLATLYLTQSLGKYSEHARLRLCAVLRVSQTLDGVNAFQCGEEFSGQDDVALSELQVVPAFGDLLHGSEALQLPLLSPALLPQCLQLPAQFVQLLHQLLHPLLLLHHVVHRVVVVAGDEGARSQRVLLYQSGGRSWSPDWAGGWRGGSGVGGVQDTVGFRGVFARWRRG